MEQSPSETLEDVVAMKDPGMRRRQLDQHNEMLEEEEGGGRLNRKRKEGGGGRSRRSRRRRRSRAGWKDNLREGKLRANLISRPSVRTRVVDLH